MASLAPPFEAQTPRAAPPLALSSLSPRPVATFGPQLARPSNQVPRPVPTSCLACSTRALCSRPPLPRATPSVSGLCCGPFVKRWGSPWLVRAPGFTHPVSTGLTAGGRGVLRAQGKLWSDRGGLPSPTWRDSCLQSPQGHPAPLFLLLPRPALPRKVSWSETRRPAIPPSWPQALMSHLLHLRCTCPSSSTA